MLQVDQSEISTALAVHVFDRGCREYLLAGGCRAGPVSQAGELGDTYRKLARVIFGPLEEDPTVAIWDDVIPPEERARYERGGWGSVSGFGVRPALVVVDMYTAFVDPVYPCSSPDAPAAVEAMGRVLRQARRACYASGVG